MLLLQGEKLDVLFVGVNVWVLFHPHYNETQEELVNTVHVQACQELDGEYLRIQSD